MGFFKEEEPTEKEKDEEIQKLMREIKRRKYESYQPGVDRSEFIAPIINLLKSKKFWIILAVIYLIVLAYRMGVDDATPMTNQEKREAIIMCTKWNGKVIYDENEEYSDCLTGYYR